MLLSRRQWFFNQFINWVWPQYRYHLIVFWRWKIYWKEQTKISIKSMKGKRMNSPTTYYKDWEIKIMCIDSWVTNGIQDSKTEYSVYGHLIHNKSRSDEKESVTLGCFIEDHAHKYVAEPFLPMCLLPAGMVFPHVQGRGGGGFNIWARAGLAIIWQMRFLLLQYTL